MDATHLIFVIAILIIIGLGLILFIIKKNIYILLLTVILVLIFLPSIVAITNLVKPAIRAITTGDHKYIKDIADEIFTNWHSLKIVGEKPKGRVMYLVKYPDSPMEYLAYKFFEPVDIISRNISYMGNGFSSFAMGSVFKEEDYIPVDHRHGNYYEKTRDIIAQRIKSKSIYGYPESSDNNKRERGYVYPLRSGLFRIARELKIPVVPVVVEHLSRDVIMSQRTQHIYIGKAISADIPLDSMMRQTFDFMVKHLQHHYDN